MFDLSYVPKYTRISAVQILHSHKLLPFVDKDLIGVGQVIVLKQSAHNRRVSERICWPGHQRLH